MSKPLLKAIAYVSASVDPMTPAMLEDLLVDARDFNRAQGVTGVLLYGDGTFMQYFEGEEQAMMVTYARISHSRQHSRITEMMHETIERREFADWQMGLALASKSELLAMSTASWVVRDNKAKAFGIDSVGMSLLHDFWQRHIR